MTIAKAVDELNAEFFCRPWFVCVGIGEEDGEEVIFVYTTRKTTKVPSNFRGHRVIVKKTSKPSPAVKKAMARFHKEIEKRKRVEK
jgi:hypothetical protein